MVFNLIFRVTLNAYVLYKQTVRRPVSIERFMEMLVEALKGGGSGRQATRSAYSIASYPYKNGPSRKTLGLFLSSVSGSGYPHP